MEDCVVVAVEAQAEVNKASRLQVRKRRVLIVISLRKVITLNPYEKINGKSYCTLRLRSTEEHSLLPLT